MWAFLKSSSCFIDTITNLGITIHKLKRGSEPWVLKAGIPLKVTQMGERSHTSMFSSSWLLHNS